MLCINLNICLFEIVPFISCIASTVIISSHSLRELEDICDSYGLIDDKRITSNGVLNDKLNQYHKYVVAFKEEHERNDFDDVNIISFKKDKRIISLVSTDDYESFSKKIEKYKPLVIDETNVDFEELFVIEVEKRGYYQDEKVY